MTLQPSARWFTHVPSERGLMLALFAFLFLFYILSMSGTQYSLDGMLMFQQARTLVGSRSLFFPQPIPWAGMHYTSKYGIGMSLTYVPVLVMIGWVRPDLFRPNYFTANLEFNPALLTSSLYLYSSWINPLIVALASVVVYHVARELGARPSWSLLTALVVGLASPLTVYARLDFAQPLVSLCLISAFYFILVALRTPQIRYWTLAGICMGFGFLTRLDFSIAAPWLYLICLARPATNAGQALRSRLPGIAVMTALFALGVITYLSIDWIKFGSPFQFGFSGGFSHLLLLEGSFGLLVAPDAGLLVFFPLTLLAIPMLYQEVRQRSVIAIAVTGMGISYWLFFGIYDWWWAGWSWGPRYLMPLVPIMALFSVKWASSQSRHTLLRRATFSGLALLGWLVTLNGILFNFLAFLGDYYARQGGDRYLSGDHFSFAISPLFAGWDWHQNLHAIDLMWIERLRHPVGWAFRTELAVVLLLFILAGALLWRLAVGACQREMAVNADSLSRA